MAASLEEIEDLIKRLEVTQGARPKQREPTDFPDGASAPRTAAGDRSRENQQRATTPHSRLPSSLLMMTPPGRNCVVPPDTTATKWQPTMEGGGNSTVYLPRPVLSSAPVPPEGPRRSTVKLPRYNGEEPPETYLIQVQLASQLNAWSTEETAVQVALALEGKALQILTDLQPEERFDWQALERAMKHRFGRHTHADDARDKLVSRRRKEGESLGAYAADLRSYARRGYPTFHATAQDELALQAFVWGLQPERLQEHLRLFAPKTLTAALTEAERVEHVLSTGYRPTNTRHRVCEAAYEGNDDKEITRQATTTSLQQPRRGARRTPWQSTGECYRCGEPGHIARYCPAPAPRSPAPQPPLN